MSVLQKAENRLADVQVAELVLLRELGKVRDHKAEIVKFIDMYRRFETPEEPRPDGTPNEQTEAAPQGPLGVAVVTPASVESVTAEEVAAPAFSAPSLANAGDEATVREEAQPAHMAEVEPVSRLAAGRTADAGEAGSGPGASPAPIPPSQEDAGAAALTAADAQSSESATREDAGLAAPETIEDEEPIEPARAIHVPTVRSRVAALHAEHPEYTRKQAAAALGISEGTLDGSSHSQRIKWVREGSPRAADGADPAAARDRKVDGEYQETANKRNEVAELHAAEPWLTPDEAAAVLQMPLNNLRMFTLQLDIEWGRQPRPAEPPKKTPPTSGPTLAERVKAQHKLHPTWTARMIAKELGEKETSVSTLLAVARREVWVETKPEFASKRDMLQHYGDVASRLGKAK